MSVQMLRQAWKNERMDAARFAVMLAIWGLLIVLIYPNISKTASSAIDSLPTSVQKAFSVTDFSTLAGFLGGEYLNLLWPLVAAIFAILAASSLVAQEIERGTVELWLSVPASRASLYLGKLAALAAAIVGLAVISLVGIALGVFFAGESASVITFVATGCMLAAFGLAVLGIGALTSSFSSTRGRAAGIAGAVVLLFYLIRLVSSLTGTLDWLRFGSLFTLFRPQHAFATGDVEIARLLALIGIGAVCATIGVVMFQRRDVIA